MKMRLLLVLLALPLCMFAQDTGLHTIGEKFGGGIVFYVTPNGQHGLEFPRYDRRFQATIV
jgi:hypothetical protein